MALPSDSRSEPGIDIAVLQDTGGLIDDNGQPFDPPQFALLPTGMSVVIPAWKISKLIRDRFYEGV
jgi:hypothetical protein